MKKGAARYCMDFSLLGGLLITAMVMSLCMGSVGIPAAEITDILAGKSNDSAAVNIIMSIRLPRMLAAAFLGGALSVSGYLLQTFFSNPIAGPFVLGISSGAKLTVALVMIFMLGRDTAAGAFTLIAASFAGSMISMLVILALSGRVKKGSMLIVSGVMIGYICSAVTDFVITFADDSNIVNLHNWSMGSFSGIRMTDVNTFLPLILAAVAVTFAISKQIDAYRLGENYAANVGVDIKLFRVMLVILSGLLSAAVTAFAGPVSFVGIAVPHLVKGLFGTTDAKIMIPAAFIGGGVFCLFCDLLARLMFAPAELNISSVTALLGAPVVIMIMLRRRSERSL